MLDELEAAILEANKAENISKDRSEKLSQTMQAMKAVLKPKITIDYID
jgi:hypothetical protein